MAPDKILLIVHIIAGFAALTAAVVATLTKTRDLAHRWHVYSGTVFFWGMMVVFLTALPLAVIRPNTFLFLIAILSFYFALAGWRYATHRRGPPRPLDWISAIVMAVAAGIMIMFGVFMLSRGNMNGITMIVLGVIGAALSIADLRTLHRGGAKGPERIAQHLTMMLAGAIATMTAFVVTNVPVKPAFIVWLAPTGVITPIIIVWSRRIRAGKKPKGMPELS
ncbi:MAG: hypothetical protein M3O61_12575 [Gemmatimonadota bacterium]|nr:hypothetical protein [Gemmatimonadota bacterium]